MRVGRYGALLAALSLLGACASAPKPVYQELPSSVHLVESYDSTLDPSAAVLSLVPAAATTLELTDFTQVRLTLGFGELDGTSSAADRRRFWKELPATAALSTGLIRPVDAQLRKRFGFGADDVLWEATYAGGGTSGWIMVFRESLAMGKVRRAIQAGVGLFQGAVMDAGEHLVTSAVPPAGTESWGHDPSLVALVGRPADATYVQRGCVPFTSIYGPDVAHELAAGPLQMVRQLEPLDSFAVAFGGQLATAQLGAERTDLFARLRLSGVLPPTRPDFATAFARGAADPSTGRLGYQLARPPEAVALTVQQKLPFAVCPPD